MSFLTGSAPKATFSTQPTIDPAQQGLLASLVSFLQGASPTVSDLGNVSLAALEQQAIGVPNRATPQQIGVANQSINTLESSLGYKAPSVTATNVTAPQVDSAQAFKTGVVEPLTDDFLKRTLPAIAGQQGGSAGGAYGSGAAEARAGAATDLERTLAQAGAGFAYDTSKLNTGNTLAAELANQSAGLTAGTANQNADVNAQSRVLAALGLAPTVQALPTDPLATSIDLTTKTLNPFQSFINQMIAAGTGQTQQTIGVGSGGSTGLLGGLLGGLGNFAGSAGGSSLIASLLSDRRAKEEIEQVGEVDGFPLYKFKYKGVPGKHVGVMAQDVEKRLPSAVTTLPSGLKAVNYAAVIEDVLKEAA